MQNLFVRPEVIVKMRQASSNPDQAKKREAQLKARASTLTGEQIEA